MRTLNEDEACRVSESPRPLLAARVRGRWGSSDGTREHVAQAEGFQRSLDCSNAVRGAA